MTRIGVLGVGSLAEYLIRGAKGSAYTFVVSPRSATRAARLAEDSAVEVADSNQAVLDACQMILVCLPAAEGLTILQSLSLRHDHSVLSAMAGPTIDRLRGVVAPAQVNCAMMPGYANAFGAGPCLIYPPDPAWQAFLSCLGPVHEFTDAASYETASVFGAMSGASVFLMRHLAQWFVQHGVNPETARRLVAETFRGNAEVLLQSSEPLDAIAKGVTTPGGITELLVATLDQTASIAAWDTAMDAVLARMTR